jgi:hypothetical protein
MPFLKWSREKGLLLLLFILFWGDLIIRTWATGGRYDMNEHLAFAERAFEGQWFYSNGVSDLGAPSSPYFPGIGFLALVFKWLGVDSTLLLNQVMLVMAVLCGLALFYLLYLWTQILFPEKMSNRWCFSISLMIWVTQLRVYKGYMIEFKPDTFLLVFVFLLMLLSLKEFSFRAYMAISLGVLLMATPIKQSSFLIYFVASILMLFSSFSLKQKLFSLSAYFCLAIFSVLCIFQIEGVYFFTVAAMSKHGLVPMEEAFFHIRMALMDNPILLLSALVSVVVFALWLPRYRTLEREYLRRILIPYVLFAGIWFSFSMLSCFKKGGNSGNLEVALVPMLPCFVLGAHELGRLVCRRYFERVFTWGLCLVVLASLYRLNLSWDALITARNTHHVAVAHFQPLPKKGLVGRAFGDGNTYVTLRESEFEVVSELETVIHLQAGGVEDFVEEEFVQKNYDLVYMTHGEDFLQTRPWFEALEKNYEKMMYSPSDKKVHLEYWIPRD